MHEQTVAEFNAQMEQEMELTEQDLEPDFDIDDGEVDHEMVFFLSFSLKFHQNSF